MEPDYHRTRTSPRRSDTVCSSTNSTYPHGSCRVIWSTHRRYRSMRYGVVGRTGYLYTGTGFRLNPGSRGRDFPNPRVSHRLCYRGRGPREVIRQVPVEERWPLPRRQDTPPDERPGVGPQTGSCRDVPALPLLRPGREPTVLSDSGRCHPVGVDPGRHGSNRR